jgi:hypothetical protein
MIDAGGIAFALDPKAKQRGEEWLIHCPVHEDKNPSCYISEKEDTLLWHCFGCGDKEGLRLAIEATGLYKYRSGDSSDNLRNGAAWDSWKENLSEEEEAEITPGIATMADLYAMDFPPDIPIIGPILRGKVSMFVAPTGSGKTFFCHGLAEAASTGTTMSHWRCSKAHNVAVVDGEMTGTDLVRIGQSLKNTGMYRVVTNALMAGKQMNLMEIEWQDWLIAALGPVDIIFFDNLYSLFTATPDCTSASAEYMQRIQGFLNRLKMLDISTVVFDHPTKSGTQYGSAAKAWGADLIGMMDRSSKSEEFEEGQAGFYLSFKGEDGGKVRGEFTGDHARSKWLLEDRWKAY